MVKKSAEELRVDAESGRVTAEKERVVNETDEEKGRVTAEAGRVSAETLRAANHQAAVADAENAQKNFEAELTALRDDPSHYMTPGARRYFRRVAIGYIILALGMSLGIKALSDKTERSIKDDINKAAETQCLGSIPTLNKFNTLVETQIDSNRARRALAESQGDEAIVRLTTATIVKLQESKLRVPNAKECSADLLK